MKRRKVVVTGGAGFIGSHIVEKICTDNEVIIIDDLSSGKLENIAGFNNNVKFIQGNILDADLLNESLDGVDFVFHEAALASVSRSIEDPLFANDVNICGTLNVLTAARDHNVKKVIFASSAAIYGNSLVSPQKETIPADPQSPYALTKLTGEYYCQIFSQVYNLPTICLRYFNVYGPRQDPTSEYAAVIPKFITRLLENKHLTIYGDGRQTRDFIFVEDIVDANIVAAESEAMGVFNIGSGNRTSINFLAKTLMNILAKKLPIEKRNPRLGEVRHSIADISQAESIGFKPKFTLEVGLQKTIGAFMHR